MGFSTTLKLFGVDVFTDDTLANDAKSIDDRLTGQYVLVMDCADCDLGSDISHGHYAGRNKMKIRHLLTKIVKSFKYFEEHKIIHDDIKCVWARCTSIQLHCYGFPTSRKEWRMLEVWITRVYLKPMKKCKPARRCRCQICQVGSTFLNL